MSPEGPKQSGVGAQHLDSLGAETPDPQETWKSHEIKVIETHKRELTQCVQSVRGASTVVSMADPVCAPTSAISITSSNSMRSRSSHRRCANRVPLRRQTPERVEPPQSGHSVYAISCRT